MGACPAELPQVEKKNPFEAAARQPPHWQAGSTHIRPKPVEPDGDFLWFLRANTVASLTNGNISFLLLRARAG